MKLSHAESDLQSEGRKADAADQLRARIEAEASRRQHDDEYRRDALGFLVGADGNDWLHVWTLMHGSEIEQRGALVALNRKIDRYLEDEVGREFAEQGS